MAKENDNQQKTVVKTKKSVIYLTVHKDRKTGRITQWTLKESAKKTIKEFNTIEEGVNFIRNELEFDKKVTIIVQNSKGRFRRGIKLTAQEGTKEFQYVKYENKPEPVVKEAEHEAPHEEPETMIEAEPDAVVEEQPKELPVEEPQPEPVKEEPEEVVEPEVDDEDDAIDKAWQKYEEPKPKPEPKQEPKPEPQKQVVKVVKPSTGKGEHYAIIATGGKQLLVRKDMTIFIEKIEGKEGSTVKFEQILVVNGKVGKPLVTGAVVSGTIEKQGKHKKIVVYRHNAKSTFKRKYGHRQPYTRVLIKDIKG